MHPSGINYLPLPGSYFLLLVALFGVLAAVVFLRAVRHAYISVGVAPRWVFAVLLLSLVGSYVNIPLVHFPGERTGVSSTESLEPSLLVSKSSCPSAAEICSMQIAQPHRPPESPLVDQKV
jgi:hypothetical protein